MKNNNKRSEDKLAEFIQNEGLGEDLDLSRARSARGQIKDGLKHHKKHKRQSQPGKKKSSSFYNRFGRPIHHQKSNYSSQEIDLSNLPVSSRRKKHKNDKERQRKQGITESGGGGEGLVISHQTRGQRQLSTSKDKGTRSSEASITPVFSNHQHHRRLQHSRGHHQRKKHSKKFKGVNFGGSKN